MAKVKNMKIRVSMLNDFADRNVINVILQALESRDILLFETICSEWTKKNIIAAVNDLWQEARETANKYEAKQLRNKIEENFNAVENCRDCLKLKPNLQGRISYNWKIYRLKREKVLLRDVIAIFITEHRATEDITRQALVEELEKRLFTSDMQYRSFIAHDIEVLRPEVWPMAEKNCLATEQVPYLETLLASARAKGYSESEMREAWDEAVSQKFNQMVNNWPLPDRWDYINLPEALCVLFAGQHPHTMKEHYTAYHGLVDKVFYGPTRMLNIPLATATA